MDRSIIISGVLLCCSAAFTFSAEVVSTNSVWKFKPGTSEASSPVSAWRDPGFAEAGFTDSPAPFWYGDPRSGGTHLTDMQNNYTCMFLRHEFSITDTSAVAALDLKALVDDGFIAWINGTEVKRVSMDPGEPTYQTLGLYDPDAPDPAQFFDYPLPAPSGYLTNGVNVIAVQVFNTSPGSSDVSFDTRLTATILETVPPQITNVLPAAGVVSSLNSITIAFSEVVTGVNASDLRVNGAPASAVSGQGDSYTFSFVEPAEGNVSIGWTFGHGITDLATPPNPFDETAPGATWQYTLVDSTAPAMANLHPAIGEALRSLRQVEVTFSEPVSGVQADDLLINGSPATNVTFSGGPYIFAFPQPATGTVSVAWVAGHGITDTAATPNAFAGGAWSYTLDPNLPPFDLRITEFLAASVSTNGLADEDGEPQDWIEIHNSGGVAADLANWSLSDDPALPGLWPLPARTLAPGEFLVIFASGKDRKPVSGELHTNFKLAISGEHLGLYSPDSPRLLADGFDPFPEQRNDVSYGPEIPGVLRYFATPTPGSSNGTSSIVGVVEPVHANVQRGHFGTPFTLVLSCPTAGATLRYTTDGSEPSASSPVFPASLTISDTTLLRAAGFKANHLPSRTVTHSYLFNLPESIRSLPVLSIVTDTNHLWGPTGIMGIGGGHYENGVWVWDQPGDYHNPTQHGLAWERPTSVEWMEREDGSGFQIDCGIRVQGSDWNRPRSTPDTKYSFRLYFRGDYGPGRLNYPLFPLTSVDRFDGLVLRAGYNDQSDPFIRDEIHRRLSSDMGQIATHGNMAIVLVNGEYYDNPSAPNIVPAYNPCERIHEEFFQEHLGGSDEWDVTKQYGEVVDGTWTDFENMYTYIYETADVLNPSDYSTIGQWLDLTNYVDYLLLNTYAAMGDWPENNWRAGKDQGPGGIWRFVVWDAEWGMGIYGSSIQKNSFQLSNDNNPFQSGLGGDSPIAWIYQGLQPSPEFRLLWADRVQKHFFNGGALTQGHMTQRFEELQSELSLILPNMNAATRIPDWINGREPIFFNQMNAEGLLSSVTAPSYSQHGGRVPVGFSLGMSAPSGTIYYTTDGSDPRVPFTGAVSGSASAYSAAVPVNSTLAIKARARQGSTWSALAEATFTYAALGTPLRISEIMYNAVGGSIFEFIELENTSAAVVDLGGMYFDGISFAFTEGTTLAGGGRLVIGSNTDTNSWKARYNGVPVAGWFAGTLSNGGERIELLDDNGKLITSVEYADGGGWPKAADGEGRSLEVIDPNGDPDDPANWQASGVINGTPDVPNTAPPPQPVYLNEVMAENLTAVNHGGTYPDWVELHNPGGTPVSIAGWSLTDSGNARKYVFPGGTTVPANGYLVVWCDAGTNATPGLHSDFSLDNDGETLSLFDDNTNRVDAMTFGLQASDYSVGRISEAWMLNNPTPNAVNSAATLAPVSSFTINEWMANPLPDSDDWLELHNQSASLPASLTGIYLSTSNDLHQLTALSFVAPLGHVQLRADHGVGPDHLEFNLAAGGDQVAVYDNTGGLIEQLSFAAQTEAVSQGRLPDGNTAIVSFPGTASPAAQNYLSTYAGPVINEVLARNESVNVNGSVLDFVELYNPTPSAFNLGGMSLSVDKPDVAKWVFAPNTILAAFDYLLIPCDGSSPASTNAGSLNLGDSLNGQSGGVWLFNTAGQVVDSMEYGPQIEDLSVGLSGSQRKLLVSATPGSANSASSSLGSTTTLSINEWMADEAGGADWFEIYNPASLPVDLSLISLSDDPSILGAGKFIPSSLSFVAADGFVKWVADDSAGQGLNHVNFALDGRGDSILIHRINGPNFVPVDAVGFGGQTTGISVGRIPDGSGSIFQFTGSASPAESNYRLLTNVILNELLTHTDPPLEDAIELYNPSGTPLDVSGWHLSNSRKNFRKYQIPGGTTIPAGGYAAFYEYQFNDGSTNAFALNSARGDEVWLSKADGGGNETYDRLVVEVGAAFNGVSFGPVITSVGVDYAPLSHISLGVSNPISLAQFRTGTGASNGLPVIGPVIINELLYNPPGGTNGSDEYIELFNNSQSTVPLYHSVYPTNVWKLGGGLDFTFPAGTGIAAGAYVLIVEFDPVSEPATLANFRTRYGVSTNIPVFGPFTGQLDNDADQVELHQPDTPQSDPPDAGFVPYLRVDRVDYSDDAPWPSGAVDGGGLSLQRTAPDLYGNEPLNWFEAAPTPGAANDVIPTDTDGDGIPDVAELAMGLNPSNPGDAAADNDLDGMSNLAEYLAGTNHVDPGSNLKLAAQVEASNLVLRFEAVSNKTYSVLYKDALSGANWFEWSEILAQPVNRSVFLTNTLSAPPVRFYQVVTPAIP